MSKIIGLTGGIGSGKSSVAKLMAEQGADIIDTDEIARELVAPGEAAYQAIIEEFGDSVLGEDRRLDRKALREQIFADKTKRVWLENLLHPQIRVIAEQRAKTSQADWVVVVIPLLRKRESYPYLQAVWTVEASEKKRIERIQARDQVSAALAKNMMANQPDEAARRKVADLVIRNSGTLAHLAEQVYDAMRIPKRKRNAP